MLIIPKISFSQKQYITTFKTNFSGGSDFSGFSGTSNADIVCSLNAVDGWLNAFVKKVKSPLSSMLWYPGTCWSKCMIFDQTNRYIEFRVKCDTVQTKPITVNLWDSCYGCCAENKKYNNQNTENRFHTSRE